MTDRIRAHFSRQAESCRRMGSPFMGRVCDLLAARLRDDTVVGRKILTWPGEPNEDAVALRLAGGLHRLVLTGEDSGLSEVYPASGTDFDDDALWDAIAGACESHDQTLALFIDSPPQTNEVARSGVLLGGFLSIAEETSLPLRLLEIGASAGLNLHWDAWGYRLGQANWGHPESAVQLAPEWRGPLPPLGPVEVVSRAGCDQAPVDPSIADNALRLRSFIWADQRERLSRLDAAIAHAVARGTRVEKADAADWVAQQLAPTTKGAATVLYHSVMWQYLPEATRASIRASIKGAANGANADAPFAWLRMEPNQDRIGGELRISLWPGDVERRLANVDFHGRWVEWLG